MLKATAVALLLFAGVEQRTLSLWASDPQTGAPAEGLTAADVAVLEDGVVVEGLEVQRDERPLTVALVLDSSQSVTSLWRLHIHTAVADFVRALPAGTRVGAWTTGERVRRLVEFSEDRERIAKALERTMPFGPNSLLDAMVEASKELRKQPGDRSVLIALSGAGFGFTNQGRDTARERIQSNVMVVFGILFDEGFAGRAESGLTLVGRPEHEYVLTQTARRSGGMYQPVPSAQGTAAALTRVGLALRSQYLVRYKTQPRASERRTEIKTRFPLTVRLGPASVEEEGAH